MQERPASAGHRKRAGLYGGIPRQRTRRCIFQLLGSQVIGRVADIYEIYSSALRENSSTDFHHTPIYLSDE